LFTDSYESSSKNYSSNKDDIKHDHRFSAAKFRNDKDGVKQPQCIEEKLASCGIIKGRKVLQQNVNQQLQLNVAGVVKKASHILRCYLF
jgi:hypothetical protein